MSINHKPLSQQVVVISGATHPGRDIYVGGPGKLLSSINKYAPGAIDWVQAKVGVAEQKQAGTKAVNPGGSLHLPAEPHAQLYGQYPGHVMKTSLYTRATLHPVVTGVLAAVTLAATTVGFAGWQQRAKKRGK